MNWEFATKTEMNDLLVGDYYGPNPTDADIIAGRERLAKNLIELLGIGPSSDVLDLGSGAGYVAKVVARVARTVRCLDMSKSFLAKAKEYCADMSNVSFDLIDGISFPCVPNESIDAGYASAVFIHLDHFQIYGYLKEIFRVLKPGSMFWVDINLDSPTINFEMFVGRAEMYLKNPADYHDMIWVSKNIVEMSARWTGLGVLPIDSRSLVFTKAGGNQYRKGV